MSKKEPFEVEFNAKEVQKFLEKSAKKLSDLRPLMREAAQGLKFVVDQNFETEGTFTGEKWKEWDEKYKKWRLKQKKGQGSILTFEGRLRRSIVASSSATEAIVGTNVKYAAAHNFGCDKTVNKKSKLGKRFSCNMNIPKREFMRINQTEQENLIADLYIFLKEMLFEKEVNRKVFGE